MTKRVQIGLEMKDQGLQQAIGAAGGVAALARGLGIAQPSVSNWVRVPTERVVAVENITGVSRAQLRPDLFGSAEKMDHDEVDLARAREYMLLSSLIRQAPSQDLLTDISKLQGDASPLGLLHLSLADAADETDAQTESREYFRLFVGVGRGELLPYASYYLTGFLHERPLAHVREDLLRLGIARAAGLAEPEDNLGILFDVMAGLILGQFGTEPDEAQTFFASHLKSWAGRVFADLETCKPTPFYRAVARVGRAFIDIETEGFSLPA